MNVGDTVAIAGTVAGMEGGGAVRLRLPSLVGDVTLLSASLGLAEVGALQRALDEIVVAWRRSVAGEDEADLYETIGRHAWLSAHDPIAEEAP